MNTSVEFQKQRRGYIRTSLLVLLAFSSLFFSRPLRALGAPEAINFAHFALVPFACFMAMSTTRTKDRDQVATVWNVILSLIVFISVMLISALINQADIINVILNFLLLGEVFLMLLAVISLSMTLTNILTLQKWLLGFSFINLIFAYGQRYLLGFTNPDFINGVFLSIAGSSISSIVSLSLGIYYCLFVKTVPLWIRFSLLAAAIWQILISDAKLVLGSFVIGFFLLTLTRLNQRTLLYIIFSILLIYGLSWAVANLEAFASFGLWLNPQYFEADGEFFRAKSMALKVIPTYFQSPLNWMFGLGPGHSIGRLGGWMLDKYGYFLLPLGATYPNPSMANDIMLAAFAESRAVSGTAMFGPLFSWAGIWGDLGFVGLGSYLLCWWIVWKKICVDDFCRLLVLTTFVTGFFPGYLEEPGSMLFVAFMIGLRWHEHQEKKRIQRSADESLFLSLEPLS